MFREGRATSKCAGVTELKWHGTWRESVAAGLPSDTVVQDDG